MAAQKTALLSAYHKDGNLDVFAHELVKYGWNLLASAGTKAFLDKHGVPSCDIGDIVGPPILGHRVVTLDRRIYAALLSRRGNADDDAELVRIGIDPIDLVYVDLYPLDTELTRAGATPESILEKVDIGGPALLRAAAKGGRYVVTSANDFPIVTNFFRSEPGMSEETRHEVGRRIRHKLRVDAEGLVARYAATTTDFYIRRGMDL